MKIIKTIGIVVIALFAITFYLQGCDDGGVDYNTFQNAHDTLNAKVDKLADNQKVIQQNQQIMKYKLDSIMVVLSTMEGNQNSMMYDIDTLKAGQILIYSEIISDPSITPSQSRGNWATRLINYLD